MLNHLLSLLIRQMLKTIDIMSELNFMIKKGVRSLKNCIVYFSRCGENYVNGDIKNLEEGNSEVAAKMIHAMIESDLFQIETVHDYPQDYHQCTKQAKLELENNERPEILDHIHHFHEYDNIFVCYPNWWSTMPMALFTFFECHNTAGKNIIPLCTHEGSGMGRSEKDIQKLCPQACVFKGLALKGSQVHQSQGIIKKWLDDLKIEK